MPFAFHPFSKDLSVLSGLPSSSSVFRVKKKAHFNSILDGSKNLNVQGEGEHYEDELHPQLQQLGELEDSDSSDQKLYQGRVLQRG